MKETISEMLHELEAMPPQEALLILYVCFELKPLGEAAREVGLPPEDASRLLSRAKKRLQERVSARKKAKNRRGVADPDVPGFWQR
jgi:DNA-directed RNA polymerase specialized sigma24 family protein